MDNQIEIKNDDGRIFYDMKDTVYQKNPCSNCGVCCSYFRVSFYFGEIDNHHLGHVPKELTSKINDFYACMKGTEKGRGKCIALSGSSKDGDISCSIYNNRPTPCREFPVFNPDGSMNSKCLELRKINNIL